MYAEAAATAAAPIAGNEDSIKQPETSVTVYPGVTLETPDTALVRKYRGSLSGEHGDGRNGGERA